MTAPRRALSRRCAAWDTASSVRWRLSLIHISPEQIITMDWLAENVIGEILPFDTLIDAAKPLVTIQGVGKAEKPSKIL